MYIQFPNPVRLVLPLLLLCASSALASAGRADDTTSYPAPPPAAHASDLGSHIQRTMTLLATSSPQHRNHVRILFYGQSITEQEWSKTVADDLRKRFPNADLEIVNRAIGGYASQLLVRPAEYDLYPYYPDLVIFHVYGSNKEYEDIIRNIRTRTTAEVLMQKDHVTAWPPEKPDREKDKGLWWDDLMNNQLLPDIAKKYGCGLADNRTDWLNYLKENHQEPRALLKDGVHLNDWGNFLMAALVSRNLVYRPELPSAEWKNLARDYRVGKEAAWKNGVLTLEFEGNRVDALPAVNAKEGSSVTVEVTIDGKKPSEIAEAYAFTRPQPGPWSPLFIKRIDYEKPLVAEEWTIKVLTITPDGSAFTYSVKGSVTGEDGTGASGKRFVSTSGRVLIDPDDLVRVGTLPVGYEIHTRSYVMGTDLYAVSGSLDPARDNATPLVQGLANGHHTVTLTARGSGKPTLRALRVYTPPIR